MHIRTSRTPKKPSTPKKPRHGSGPRTATGKGVLVAAAAALLVAAVLPNTAGAAQDRTDPAGLADRPGDIVSSAPTSFHPLPGQPTNTRAWHIEYRSTTADGKPNTVSGTVIVPKDGRKGPRPLVTYAVGTVGLADKCAPSKGFPSGTTIEANLINVAVQRGWAVAVTDYEGLGTPGEHTYTVGRAEGQSVLDAARAAQRLPEAGLPADGPVGIMGYSQGGQASSWAAELHDSYAPELNVKGTATGGVPGDLMKVADFNDGNIGAGLILMAATGQNAAFPELRLDKYLNDKGRFYVDFMKNNCVAIDTVAALFQRISDVTVKNPLDEPDWQQRLRESNLGSHRPDHPVYLYHGGIDELIPYRVGQQLRSDWCAKGATVQWRSHPLLGHIGGVTVGAFPAMDWLADRFAGERTRGNC
ncbi:lipase family protein [Streptomyces sp. H27-D2]|uniref:lipase family protein n=1 Tax=Streptomyces sp. H27-D2 TaxID=3046304 RepID=UPI002DB588F3|nr:lipase family protein [Streptomyces sp. H27-D2]MEC4017026.1 lipase family protein [Streptomyces sp. H27-D2]